MIRILLIILALLIPVSECSAAVAWYIAQYKRDGGPNDPGRYCAIDDFRDQILADGGSYDYTEILGNNCLIKVKAPAADLTTLSSAFTRIPLSALDTTLAGLTTQQKNTLRSIVVNMGYSNSELQAAFPNDLGTYTLRQLLHFMAQRRLRPRYDKETDQIIVDGQVDPVRPIEEVEANIQ